MARAYRHQEFAAAPQGWRVRSRRMGEHVIRLAFPPGPRRRGAGQLLEVLHPKKNPACANGSCDVAKKNPSELLIFGNPSQANGFREDVKSGSRVAIISANEKEGPFSVRLYVNNGETATLTHSKAKTLAGARKQAAKMLARNPSTGGIGNHKPGCKCAFCKRARKLAAAKETKFVPQPYLGHGPRYNVRANQRQLSVPEKHQLKIARDTLKMADAMAAVMGGPSKVEAREIIRRLTGKTPKENSRVNPELIDAIKHGSRVTIVNRFGQRRTGRAVMRTPFGGWVLNMGGAHGTPAIATSENVVKVSGGNPVNAPTKIQVWFDEGIKKYNALIYDPKFGNLYATGYTKKQAAHALHDRVREARRAGTWRNPRGRRTRNPEMAGTRQAVRLFETFHGRDAQEVVEKQVSAAMRMDYTALGDLVALGLGDCPKHGNALTNHWDECNNLLFEGDGVKLASSPEGRQLYLIGGNQNLEKALANWDGIDPQKDLIDLGECGFVVYEARKKHSNFEPVDWVHEFGEGGHTVPRILYDRLKRQVFLSGGEYFIDASKELSPGIEG